MGIKPKPENPELRVKSTLSLNFEHHLKYFCANNIPMSTTSFCDQA